jgi:HNH endonuclease
MVAELFESRERAYRRWLKQNQNGFVLTAGRQLSLEYMSLHRASCRMIGSYMKNMTPGAFTERRYVKICASTTSELMAWVRDHGGRRFTKACKLCKPNLGKIELRDLETYLDDLEKEVSKARQDNDKRRRRLRAAPVLPDKVTMTVTTFIRNPDVIAEVLERANGKCEFCKTPAPFLRAKDRSPYLEVHHKRQLAHGGEDSIENAIALCPNCHREAHFGKATVAYDA